MKTNKAVRPLLLVFFVMLALLFTLKKFMISKGLDPDVLFSANALFFIISMLIFLRQKKAIGNPNPNVFVRSVIGGMMLKMFLTAGLVVLYVLLAGDSYNKYSVFASLFIYLFYLAAEAAVVTGILKSKNA